MSNQVNDPRVSVVVDDPVLEGTRLGWLNEHGFLAAADLLIAVRVARLAEQDLGSFATLVLAFALRSVREGSTALALADLAVTRSTLEDDAADEGDVEGAADAGTPVIAPATTLADVVDLPEPGALAQEIRDSELARLGMLHVEEGLVYLDRYRCDEKLIAEVLLRRASAAVRPVDMAAVEEEIGRVRGGAVLDDRQQDAVRSVAQHPTTVLTGGPGMGKTHTIATVLDAMRAGFGDDMRVALAAPTGKAAARMTEQLREILPDSTEAATTIHRLLGSLPSTNQRFRHDRGNPLPHDLVIIDEASMISLSQMARLLEAVPDTARLLLVGDPNQLASVEAGCVLADLVAGLRGSPGSVELEKDHRLAGVRVDVAAAFRAGDAERVLEVLDGPDPDAELIETDEPTPDLVVPLQEQARELRRIALKGDHEAALRTLAKARLLCGHRTGPFGTGRWNRVIEQGLIEEAPEVAYQEMYVGRPLLVTRNDHGLGLANGDTGVIVAEDGEPVAWIETSSGPKRFSPWRLSDVETMHAMTVHKSQGSQAEHVTVIVPPLESRLLTRELLYTAVTRAKARLTVIGSREAIRAGVAAPVKRSSGLARRLEAGRATAAD